MGINITWVDNTESGKQRLEDIKLLLPTQTIISEMLEPIIEKRLFDVLAKCVEMELEIFRKYPKKPLDTDAKTFDPRNNETCFMGKGFKQDGEFTNSELSNYRKAIGTIPHPVWGNCTLLEIWGGDHFEDFNKMVLGAFEYGMNLTDKKPKIKFFTNSLFQNKKSKTFHLSDAQKDYQNQMNELLAKAMVFGVNEPKKRKPRLK